jgi:two-component system response regulator DevR
MSMTEPTPAAVRVLLVDDHQMFAESLSRLLRDEVGIEVLGIAGTVREALDAIPRLRPQVVLVDYELPDGNGIEVMTHVKTTYPDTMVVMLTGSTEDRVLLDAISAGCSGFLTKNRAAADVAEAVRGAAAGEALISPQLLGRLLPKLTRTYRSLGSDLTDRERTTLDYLAKGWANKAIAAEMNLSLNTVRNYVHSLLTKLGAHSKLEAVSIAVRQGIIDYSS